MRCEGLYSVNAFLNSIEMIQKINKSAKVIKDTSIRMAAGGVALLAGAVLVLTLPVLAVDCGNEFMKNKKEAMDRKKNRSHDVKVLNSISEEEKSPTKVQIFSATLVNIIIMGGSVAAKGP